MQYVYDVCVSNSASDEEKMGIRCYNKDEALITMGKLLQYYGNQSGSDDDLRKEISILKVSIHNKDDSVHIGGDVVYATSSVVITSRLVGDDISFKFLMSYMRPFETEE